MLTVIAWIVFLWMSAWNVLYWSVGFFTVVSGESKKVRWKRTAVEAIVSLALWIVPGVYLFGWF